jgi:hypothetical protein
LSKDILEVSGVHPALKGIRDRFAVPITIVALTLLRVREDSVGLIDQLKTSLGVGLLASIWVVLERELAIGLLDLIGARATLHP